MPQLFVAFHQTLPALTQLADEVARKLFRRERKRLPLIGVNIGPNEKAGAAAHRAGIQCFPITSHQGVFHGEGEAEFGGGKNVAARGTARRRSVDGDDLGFQRRVGHVSVCDPERPVLLELLDDGSGDQRFDSRDERAIGKSRHRDRVDMALLSRSRRAEFVTRASAEQKRKQQEWNFVHSGEAAVQGVGSGVAEGAELESVVEGGAVVLSGKSEAGGGSETSVSEGGSGASRFEEGGALSMVRELLMRFLSAAAAVTAGACSFASPTFARSSLIRFLAFFSFGRARLGPDHFVVVNGGGAILLLFVVELRDVVGRAALLVLHLAQVLLGLSRFLTVCG